MLAVDTKTVNSGIPNHPTSSVDVLVFRAGDQLGDFHLSSDWFSKNDVENSDCITTAGESIRARA